MTNEHGHPYTNALIHERSPYLLQHAHNPVNWMPWNDHNLQKAKTENKLIIVSVGYSACHWCHVMERESFENEAIADFMNEHFISIKVDREERPDVDQVYMDAAQLTSGRGGWPLNAICLPDSRPVFAGTYFPPDRWMQVLKFFVNEWQHNRAAMNEQAGNLTNGIRQMDTSILSPQAAPPRADLIARAFDNLSARWDYDFGGRQGAPKFPMPAVTRFLLQHSFLAGNQQAMKAATVTLNGMMNGGLYDQVGGGFARYSVDEQWMIPHFEKMLYDNAQLITLYAEAYAATKNERYREVVSETTSFIEREWKDESGGYCSALDADSEGHEGRFYVWSDAELKSVLGNDYELFGRCFDLSPNFEGQIHLQRKPETAAGVSPGRIAEWKQRLLQARTKRVRPMTDTKIICSWNAMLCSAYLQAHGCLQESNLLEKATALGRFLLNKMRTEDGKLQRLYHPSGGSSPAFLDDYAFTIQAFTSLFQHTGNQQWLDAALSLLDVVFYEFSHERPPMFYYTSKQDTPLIARKTELSDNVIPSSNAMMAVALCKLGVICSQEKWLAQSKNMCKAMQQQCLEHPGFYAEWLSLTERLMQDITTVVITGAESEVYAQKIESEFIPHSLVMHAPTPVDLPLFNGKFKQGETLIHICAGNTCLAPVKDAATAIGLLQKTD